LYSGLTNHDRKQLAQNTGIPENKILELVKLSNLARVGGLKKIRGRLYHDAGFDTLEKIANCTGDEIRQHLKEYIEKSKFKGIPPTPKEASRAVSMSKHLKRIVVY
jgi:hypothetical protein